MNKQKVIIDCDPGIDDSLALLYALQHPALEVVALTITAGNVPVELGADNAFKILERLDQTEVAVYVGADQPLVRPFISAQDTHGRDGLGETDIPRQTDTIPQIQTAADFLAQYFQEPTETSLIALGPLTNIAQALKSNPRLGQHMQRFVSMGGSYKSHGNCSPVAEYNYWCDPHAAKQVFARLGKTIEMIGLDVTRKIVLTPDILEYMHQINPEKTEFIRQITRFYFDFHWRYEHILGCVINDPLAIAYFIQPGICKGFDSYTDVVTDGIALGQTVADAYDLYQHPINSHILTQVKPQQFFSDFLSTILATDASLITEDLKKLKLGEQV